MAELGARDTEDEEMTGIEMKTNEVFRQNHSEAIRIHSLTLKDALMIPSAREGLIDLLLEKGCLTDAECPYLNDAPNQNEKDKARKLVVTIMSRSYKTMETFLQCLNEIDNFKYLVEMIYKSFDEGLKQMKIKQTCNFCFLKKSFDIKTVYDVTFQTKLITLTLMKEIIDGRSTTDELWEMFAEHCNKKDSKGKKKVVSTIRRHLKTTGQYCELFYHMQRMCEFICKCESLQNDETVKKCHKKLMKWRAPQDLEVFEQTEHIYDQRVAVEHQDERMSDTKPALIKRLCLKAAISLNVLSFIDSMILYVRNDQHVRRIQTS